MKVLVIEDNAEIVESVSICLQLRWPNVDVSCAVQGAKGIKMLESERFDIVILDLNLPDMDGFEVLNRLRTFSEVPVIILSVREAQADRARGLEIGADDYIVKPFSPIDLVARVSAVLRRARVRRLAEDEISVDAGRLNLNLTNHEVSLEGEKVRLTPTEWKLLYALVKNADRTVNSKQLLRHVWGEEQTEPEALRTYIRRLRTKLKDSPPRMIVNDHGEGYRFVRPR